jgi:hypothetical protein
VEALVQFLLLVVLAAALVLGTYLVGQGVVEFCVWLWRKL